VPLAPEGFAQARVVAEQIARLKPPVGLIITSSLRRNRQTAAIIAKHLPQARVIEEPAFGERRLGDWNLLPIELTQPWFEARKTPPGGESEAEFFARIAGAVRKIKQQLPQRPLLVGSKGVARILAELIGVPGRLELDNGALWQFDFAAHPCLETAWSAL
jgi:2,3-bisphosphoglycerate-dependent phosphoglycerate mutase